MAKKDDPTAGKRRRTGSQTQNEHMADDAERQEIVNKKLRDERINGGFLEIYDIEREIERLTLKHLSALKEARTKEWRLLKADTGIDRRILSVRYAEYKLARSSIEIGDQEAIDALREIHGALFPGQTVDWIKALQAEDQMNEAVAERERQEAKERGENPDQGELPAGEMHDGSGNVVPIPPKKP